MKPADIIKIAVLTGTICCAFRYSRAADDNIREMQDIYFYAKKFYDEGKYEESMEEFKRILDISPGHGESMRMINLCEEKITLTEAYINQALDKYRQGMLTDTAEILEKALEKNPKSYKVKTLLSKTLTEMGMEYSFSDNHGEALKFFRKAKKISPDDNEIDELIKISDSMIDRGKIYAEIPDDSEAYDKSYEEYKKSLESMMNVFDKYQKNQNKLLDEYTHAQERIQGMVERSEEDRRRLYTLLKEKEDFIADMLEKQENERKELYSTVRKNILIAGVIVVCVVSVTAIIIRKQIKDKKSDFGSQIKMQEKLAESLKKYSESQRTSAPAEDDKKHKKLEIIKKELVGRDRNENEVALRMLRGFLSDKDNDIVLKAVRILYEVNPGEAVDIIKKIIIDEKQDFREAACTMLGEIGSEICIEKLLELVEHRDKEVRKSCMNVLVKVLNRKDITGELRQVVEKKVTEIYKKGEWIVM
ncbi:MAG: hypothetical protein JXJ19_09940 [Elusimicrobia bacterium]|nr:hypothetical protein [Elusimicrobiota bacterium]